MLDALAVVENWNTRNWSAVAGFVGFSCRHMPHSPETFLRGGWWLYSMIANFLSDIRRVPVNRTTVPAPVIPRSNDIGYLCVGSPPGVDWMFRGSVVPSSVIRLWSHLWYRGGKQAFEGKR